MKHFHSRSVRAALVALPLSLYASTLLAQQPANGADSSVQTAQHGESSTQPISLTDALTLALSRNPELAAFGKERGATEAAVQQAGVLPNPTLGVIGDNLGNERARVDGDRSVELQVGQLIELGGKRGARVRLAETAHDLAGWDLESKRSDLLLRVTTAFIDVLAAQRGVALAEESLRLAQLVADVASKRAHAGKVSPVEETRARVALASTRIEVEQARRELTSARSRLGAQWNDPNPRFEAAKGELLADVLLPSRELLLQRISDNPDLKRWSSEIARREAGINVEKAKRVPDVTVSGGVKRFSQFNDTAYMVGISVPIPLFDRNRGGVLEATRRLGRTLDEQRAAETRVQSELDQAYQRAASALTQLDTLRMDVLPGAQSAFEATTKGYQLGKFGFLDVLDAQRALFQARAQQMRAAAEYQRAFAEIERLVGGAVQATTIAAPARQ
ncbi:MAG TPA: TolC family protein [Burkholderiales bacterium]|nr:TolC family protein [Burkholderiales bacterium]